MKILSLQLSGYKRFIVSNFNTFTITPTKMVQLIIGTNGSGKSSLLGELTPLPAYENDFYPNGSKSISLEHHGAMYDLKSTFSGKQNHSFVKSGNELNPGGTASVQRELVRKEFGITNEIQTLITNQIKFCSMSPSDRRYWLTKLADTNFDYAISLFNKFKEKHRDIAGSLKIAKNRLVVETSKIITNEEKDVLQKEVDSLHETLQFLMEYRKPLDKTPAEHDRINQQIQDKICFLFNTFMKKKNNFVGRGLDVEQIDERVQVLESDKKVQELLIVEHYETHAKVEQTIELLTQTGGEGAIEFQNKIQLLNKDIEAKKKLKSLGIEVEDAENTLLALETVVDTLTDVFHRLPSNADNKFSKLKLQTLNVDILAMKDKNTKLAADLSKHEGIKQHQEHQKSKEITECPQCSHKWAKGFDQKYYNDVCEYIERTQEHIDDLATDLAEKLNEQQEITEYVEIYKSFWNCTINWPILKPLWNYFVDNKTLTIEPRSGLNILNVFRSDLARDVEVENLSKQVKRFEELLVISESVGQADIFKLRNNCVEIETKIEVCTKKSVELINSIKDLKQHKRDILELIDLSEQMQILSSSFTLNYTEHKEAFRRDALIDVIKSVQIRLSKKEQTLSEVNIQTSIIADIQKQVDLQQLQESAYKALMKELSPTEGLIAEGLIGFISNFVQLMNNFIDKIWLYPLEVIPCGLDEDGTLELDYKFPLRVQNKPDKVPDVSKGSSAMQEIVDLAFKITALKYLGLEDTPLLIDEFGKTFDKEHRVAAAQGIKQLIEMRSFTQLFTISHYEATYGSLTNAEVCVLCSNNIAIPTNAVYNEHVIME
jgi:hypothetical protein